MIYLVGRIKAHNFRNTVRGLSILKEFWIMVNGLIVYFHYDKEHNLSGILYHYPFDSTYEKRGNCNILVKPDKRRQGIATALLKKGIKRFKIDLNIQTYSESGKHFIMAYKVK